MSSHDSGFYSVNDQQDLAPEEQYRVEQLAGKAYNILNDQPDKQMSLADYTDELRGIENYDISSSLIDAIIEYMCDCQWVSRWVEGNGEWWIKIEDE